MSVIDVTLAVAEFVADSDRTSLTLPHMSAGQRKSANKLLDQHPEVQCESYGFGAERQLHLFKNAVEEAPAMDLVNIKNTFIDDWMAPSSPVDRRVIQSMPHGMFRKCIFAEDAEGAKGYDTPSTSGCETPLESDLEASEPEASETEAGAIASARWAADMQTPAFNGCSAVVQGWDEATGRYNILLASPHGVQQAKIKDENLRLVLPCP